MELPPSNLHRLIIPKPPIPFNYNRCPFWLIVCLHSGVLPVLMHSPSHYILKRPIQYTSSESTCENVFTLLSVGFLMCSFVSGAASRDLLLCSSLQGLPGPPGEKGENGDVGPMVSVSSLCDFSPLQRFTLSPRTTQRGGKLCWSSWSFGWWLSLATPHDRCFGSLWKMYWHRHFYRWKHSVPMQYIFMYYQILIFQYS